ncbi:hypothetical protein FACS1894159_00140 [Bacteroidia bacterium]|nr:hypothetical protein FACS1894159_00140 [Bacteroidia bacterium]
MKNHLFGAALLFAAFSGVNAQTTVLTPQFTEQSKKIVIPKEGSVFPEIHNGLIAVSKYPQLMYVGVASGEYVWGTDFHFTRKNDYATAYFSGGAMMAWRKKPDAYSASPFIIYPDGKYRDFPATTKILTVSDFCEGYALMQKGNFMGFQQVFIDKNGKEVFPALNSSGTGTMGDANIYPVRENRRVFYNATLKKYGYADKNGVVVIKPQFAQALNFSEGLAAVKTGGEYDGKWGFIDPTGKMVIPATYILKPGRFSEGLAAVRIGSSESDCEMAYIDKTGKRATENKPWRLNEFHDGYAWVGTGCDKLSVIDRKFDEVRNVTADFYHDGNGFGVCNFQMTPEGKVDPDWGIDFPGGEQSLNQRGVDDGDIFAPDGTVLFRCVDARGERVNLHAPTEGELMFCRVRIENEPRLKEKSVYLQCFINKKGEIVYWFEEGVEGFEGKKPVQIK